MKYRLEVFNDDGTLNQVVTASTVRELETELGALEREELGMTPWEYVNYQLENK